MQDATQYSLTNDELVALGKGATAASHQNYAEFVKYLIAQQGDKFLENTVSSTYVLLNADNYQALLETVKKLRAVPEIRDVNLGSTRGQAPALQFTFTFTWNEGATSAN